MQHGVRVSSIILRSENIWLKILYHGEKSISTSKLHWKEANTREKSRKTEEEKSTSKRRLQQVKWNSTNLALFGPVIKEEKRKTKEKNIQTVDDQKKAKKPFGSDELLLPVSLWDNSSVELKLEKSRYTKFSKVKSRLEETKVPHIVQIPILPEVKEPEQCPAPNDKPLINSCDTVTEIILPNAPFFQKDDIILPFPMVLNKHVTPCPNQIYTIASAKVDVPSVTQVLNKTMSDKSEMMLALWRKRKIAEVGEEGLKEFMREAKLVGKELHTSIETYLRGVEYSSIRVEPRISGHWLSMKSILNSLEDVVVLESYVLHPHLKYKGFVDCVARHKKDLVVIEWKTSQRTKSTLEDAYDDPVQIAAYVGALNADDKYPFVVENALLVVAYPTGRPADVMTLNRDKCEHYWNQWLKRLEAFNHLKSTREKE